MIKRLFKQLIPQSSSDIRRELIRREAAIGGKLFGELPKGHSRDFFCLDKDTWIWNETRLNAKGKQVTVTTRYEIFPTHVVKVQDDHDYRVANLAEVRNLYRAAHEYYQQITKQLYT